MNKKIAHNFPLLNDEYDMVQFVVNGIIERMPETDIGIIEKIVTENYRKEQRRRKRKEREPKLQKPKR